MVPAAVYLLSYWVFGYHVVMIDIKFQRCYNQSIGDISIYIIKYVSCNQTKQIIDIDFCFLHSITWPCFVCGCSNQMLIFERLIKVMSIFFHFRIRSYCVFIVIIKNKWNIVPKFFLGKWFIAKNNIFEMLHKICNRYTSMPGYEQLPFYTCCTSVSFYI